MLCSKNLPKQALSIALGVLFLSLFIVATENNSIFLIKNAQISLSDSLPKIKLP